jgi:ADP-heptose:LPS heptosyltransferase
LKHVLVIKLGALGDFVLAFGPFAAIRAHHPDARITLLTTRGFTGLAQGAPWFDAVATDGRPAWWNLPGLLRLRETLRGYDMVYDLQTSGRSGWYHRLAGRPPWSGIAAGCSHPHTNPARNGMHTVERQREQLAMAGINSFPAAETGWLTEDTNLPLPAPYALLIPGAAPHRPRKRWPAAQFATLATMLARRGQTPVIVGAAQDAPLASVIQAAAPSAIDLTGRTNLRELAAIAARASLAVGNDTGPMHLAAALGTPCITLFSADSDPALTGPRGFVTVLAAPNLADLPVQRVAEALPPVH